MSRAALALWLIAACARGADYEPGSPSTYLFDAHTRAAGPLEPAKLDPRSGWTLVPEEDLTHAFHGDVVLWNDRLIVVLRMSGSGFEVYGQTPSGPKLRAVLTPSDTAAGPPADVQIAENGPAAVSVSASFPAANQARRTLKVRISAGQMSVEARPAAGVARLAVRAAFRYVVVPDFFADDMVFGPTPLPRARLRLPAENMVLALLEEGAAQLMCVWPSSAQEAVALAGDCPNFRDPAQRGSENGTVPFGGLEIDALPDKPIWVACLEGPELWRAGSSAAAWKPPFPAKWRVDVLQTAGLARSDWWSEKRWSMPDLELLYVLDRSQATPLTTFTPMDVLRNTLGVGPCQYILQTEGLASDANPTPDNVMTWVERQFSRKKQAKAADEIRERLEQMVALVGQTQARIDRYRHGWQRLGREYDAPEALADPMAVARSKTLAEQVVTLVNRPDAAAECAKIGAELRAIGAVQDRLLAGYRMRLRWVKQSAAMQVEDRPADAAAAREIHARAVELLQTK